MCVRLAPLFALAASLTFVSPTPPASAGVPAIRVAEVRAAPASADPKISSALRQALHAGVSRLKANAARRAAKSRYLLSATLTKLDVAQRAETISTSCVVSMTVRHEKTGALIAFVDGKSRVTQAAASALDARVDAVEAAVRGALRRVDESFR